MFQIGARRCHPQGQTDCLIPVLGSGPHPTLPGSGYYTIVDYKEILKYARDRHVTVIPEIDMPGHARYVYFGFRPKFKTILSRYCTFLA